MTIIANSKYRRNITVTRRDLGSYVDGVYVEASPTIINGVAVVVPVNGEAAKKLPEGTRAENSIELYSETRLRGTRDGGPQADEVTLIDGSTWRVVHVDDWFEVGGFVDCLCVRVDVDVTLLSLYTGVSAVDPLTEEAALTLTVHRTLAHVDFSADATDAGLFVYYVYPASLADPSAFEVGGWVGGFESPYDLVVDGVACRVVRSTRSSVGFINAVVVP